MHYLIEINKAIMKFLQQLDPAGFEVRPKYTCYAVKQQYIESLIDTTTITNTRYIIKS